MRWMTRTGRWPAAFLLAATLGLLTGCQAGGDDEPSIGTYTDVFDEWPLRGSLAGDEELRAEVAALVNGWRTPDNVGGSGVALLWLGEVAGAVLALVDFRQEDNHRVSWLLEVTDEPGALTVTGARQHSLGMLNSPALPVRTPGLGPRYVVSAEVRTLAVGGDPVAFDEHGLTGPVALPQCRLTALTGHLRRSEFEALDLGLGVKEPFFPVFRDSAVAAELMADVDLCQALAADGWLGSGITDDEAARLRGPHPAIGWLRASPALRVDPADPPGRLVRVHAQYADRNYLTKRAFWLVWTYPVSAGITDLEAPLDVITDEPGLFVMRIPTLLEEELEIRYRQGGEDRRLVLHPPPGMSG